MSDTSRCGESSCFVETISRDGICRVVVANVYAIARVACIQKIVAVVVADRVIVVLFSGCGAGSKDGIIRPVATGVGDVVAVDGVVIVARGACGGTEQHGARE